jgi:hypothetical protein
VFRGSNNARFWYFGSNARTPQITASDDNTGYYVIWNETYDNSTKFTDNTTLSTIYNLNTTGQAVQLSNGANRDNMYALVYNNQNQPYFFKTTPSIGSKYGLQKSSDFSVLYSGRGGVILKDTVGFFFSVEDITINNQNVGFVDVENTMQVEDIKQLNNYLISNPITLLDNSTLSCTVIYGITNSEYTILKGNDTVYFSLDVLDASSGKLLGNIKKVAFNKTNLSAFEEAEYKLDFGNLTGTKSVRLKITASNNFNGNCLLTESYTDMIHRGLSKTNIEHIFFDEILSVTEYELGQNFPNPFNPSTKISYQIPKAGLVTLKIYDLLGKEIATLVNEQQNEGRYEVKFDASLLASGVYIYKLQAGDFVFSKKMIILK